jgi:2-polyprenyl-3-methyl-5-hydroxy-6-metoxy-1,4-benzoquinol methylase
VSGVSVRASARTIARRTLIAGLQRITRRTAVLLPPEAGLVELLDARAPYRVTGASIPYDIYPPCPGELLVKLLQHVPHGPAKTLAQFPLMRIEGHATLVLDREAGHVLLDGTMIGSVDSSAIPQRFATDLTLQGHHGGEWSRRLGHYIVGDAGDESYFTGAHYRDYESQAESDVARTLATLNEWRAQSPLLEIGCATGLLLSACAGAGFEVMGVDVSPWAVAQARTRIAPHQVVLADAEADTFPPEITTRRFRTVVMNAVLEHVHEPSALLHQIAAVMEPDGLLLLTTANANSLTRWFFGSDWEGLADPTHKSAHAITPSHLASWLESAGWQVEHLTTHSVWDDNPDPVHATLRDVAASDARFRQLLVQYGRGDFLECIARRRPA